MNKTTIKSILYLSLIIIAAMILFLPRGETVEDTGLKTDTKGMVVLSLEGDTSSRGFIMDKLPSLYRQQFTKQDYGLVAFYTYRISFDLTSIPEVSKNKLELQADTPGEITEIEGGNIREGKAIFNIALGEKNNLAMTSRQIKWLWIFVLIAATLTAIIFYLYRRQVEKYSGKNIFKKRIC